MLDSFSQKKDGALILGYENLKIKVRLLTLPAIIDVILSILPLSIRASCQVLSSINKRNYKISNGPKAV